MVDTSKIKEEPSQWQPMSVPGDVAALSKLLEEVNELGSAIARCIMQGLDEREPVTGKLNRHWLEDELADVDALKTVNCRRFKLVPDSARVEKKIAVKQKWIDRLDEEMLQRELRS